MEHCDHLKPSSWKGNLISSTCNPQAAWEAGRVRVGVVLGSHHIQANFTEIFSNPNVDMLRPFADGLYPGISSDPDPSISPLSELPAKSQHDPIDDDGDDEYEDELDTEVDVNMDDILDEPPASSELQDAAGSDWIDHDGQKFHKSSLLRIMFCSDFMRKSKERLHRVRAYTIDFTKTSNEASDEALLGISLFVLGDLFTTLIRTGQHLALAILQATGIEHKSRKVASVSAAELALENADIKVSGQVLHLIAPSPSDTSASNTIFEPHPSLNPPTSISPSLLDIVHSSAIIPTASPTFLWIGDYIKFKSLKPPRKGKTTAMTGTEAVSRNALTLTSSSCMIEPISGTLIGVQDLSPADSAALRRQGLTETWWFDVGYLKNIARSIWETVCENKWKVTETGISFDDAFPYSALSGMLSFRNFDAFLTANGIM